MAFLPVLFFLFHLAVALPSLDGALVFEDGYTVTTFLDGDKSNYKISPHAILHQSLPSDLFIVLDSAASTFYTVSMPSASTNETVIERLTGNGDHDFVDGDLGSARFNKPRSFAVDHNGNVYVVDQRNHAIRKITKSVSQQEIVSLYNRFCQLDRNGKGFISGDEFMSVLEFAVNPLSQIRGTSSLKMEVEVPVD